MKKYLFVSTLALATFMFSCNSESSAEEVGTDQTTDSIVVVEPTVETAVAIATTILTVDRMEHDFGKIPDTAPVETSFVITNDGDEPLLITNAQGSCGCTVPEYPKDPIPPGESRDMKVSFNPTGKEGVNNKTVTITANTEPATTIIYVKSDVQKTAQ